MDEQEWAAHGTAMAEVHRSDVFRYLVLFSAGGVYADFDVLFVKDFTPLLNDDFFAGFQISTRYENLINGAVLGARARSPVLQVALQKAMQQLSTCQNHGWGEFGPDLLTKILVKDCLWNKTLVRCAKLAARCHVGETYIDEIVCRFWKRNYLVTVYPRAYFYYRSWWPGEWQRIFHDPKLPSNTYAIHLWHKVSAPVADAIDETNFRETITNPALLMLCEDFLAHYP